MKADVKVIDTALKYGCESPESFTRAFTRFHGDMTSPDYKSRIWIPIKSE